MSAPKGMDAMDLIRRYLAQIRSQLAALNLSQRLLIAALAVIMLGTIAVVVFNSAKPEMVELLPQAMSPEEINQIKMSLQGKYQYQIVGDKIMVPVDQAYAIRGELAADQALPKDTQAMLDKLANENDFMYTDASNERRWNFAKQITLGKIISKYPYVDEANVLISKGDPVGIGRVGVATSATIAVKLKNNESMNTRRVLAMVDLVCGSVAGLTRDNVRVVDGSRSYKAPSEGAEIPADLLEFKKTLEDEFTSKLASQLGVFGDVKIAVNVVPDMSSTIKKSQKVDPKVVKATTLETSRETSRTDGSAPGGQPGVQTNVTANVNTTAGNGSHSQETTEETEAHNEVRFQTLDITQQLPPGTEIKDMSASISVPRSYFVSVLRRNKKDPKLDPDDNDADLQAAIKENLAKVQLQAMNAIGIKDKSLVQVDWFDDVAVRPQEAGQPGTAIAGTGLIAVFTQYTKQAVLGGVALVAVMTMLMMIRKASPGFADGADAGVFFNGGKPTRRTAPTSMDVQEDSIGEANQGEAVLTGIELDDDTLKSRKMVDEVSTMVKENPQNAAALVKKWLNKVT